MKKILRFTAEWCKPCKSLKEILNRIETSIPIEVIDIDENMELATEYGIRSVPTMIMIEDNTILKKMVGLQTIQEVESFIHD
jgi:thioredoxin 1